MTTPRLPKLHIGFLSKSLWFKAKGSISELWELADEAVSYEACERGAYNEDDAKCFRRVARNLARGQFKAACRNMRSMDTAPRDRISSVTYNLIVTLGS